MTKSAFEKGLQKEQDKIALIIFYFFLSEKVYASLEPQMILK